LAGNYPEEALLSDWLGRARERLNSLPEEFVNYVAKS